MQKNLFELFKLTGGRDAKTLGASTCAHAQALMPKSHSIYVRTASHEVKLTFSLRFGSNRNVFYLYTETSVACACVVIQGVLLLLRFIRTLQLC